MEYGQRIEMDIQDIQDAQYKYAATVVVDIIWIVGLINTRIFLILHSVVNSVKITPVSQREPFHIRMASEFYHKAAARSARGSKYGTHYEYEKHKESEKSLNCCEAFIGVLLNSRIVFYPFKCDVGIYYCWYCYHNYCCYG